MNPMLLFEYVKARQIAIELEVRQPQLLPEQPTVRDRVGRALIAIGERILATPAIDQETLRPAA